jgi:sugar phosphate isomerase/epimerase
VDLGDPILRAVLCGPDGERNCMVFRSVGINLARMYVDGVGGIAEDLETLESTGPDFVEVWPQNHGVILGGRLDTSRLRKVGELLLGADLSYTVHAPLEVNLMDLTSPGLQRNVLDASLRFAKVIGAEVVVCHAGQRLGARDARHSMEAQLSAERFALREAGDLAGELGVAIAVENYYPERPILRGAVYDYSVWPSRLAEQVSAVDHSAVGICLDVGHAALAADFFGFDFIEECAAIAPLVRHVHLHDNLQRTNLTGEPQGSEHTVFGLGDLHLPPGRGTIPLEDLFRRMDFPERPSCCVELSPEGFSLVPEALRAGRELSLAVATRERVPA